VRAEFYRAEDPKQVVGSAEWTATGVRTDGTDQDVEAALDRIFHPAPIAVDEPAYRSAGTTGPVVLQPRSLRWFTSAARVRGEAEGLRVRLIAGERPGPAWDPAGAYRSFASVIERQVAAPAEGPAGT
jgi:hypothetical protein